MTNLHNNNDGFTHHLLFAAMLVGVIGLLAFTGRKVWVESYNRKIIKSSPAQPASNISVQPQEPSKTKPPTVTVKKSGTAASAVTPVSTQSPVKEQQTIVTKQNVTTPQGSFFALIDELKAGRYTNALYFITENFMENSAELLKAVGSVKAEDCKANAACNVLINTPTSKLEDAVMSHYKPENLSFEGTSLTYVVELDDNLYESQPASNNGTYTIKIDMVDTGTNWLIDRISLEGYTL